MDLPGFVDFLIKQQALLFGDFTLKSGRKSPYFFNAGQFKTGSALTKLGEFYADKIVESGLDYDLLFGPAYKGIPLVSAVAMALYQKYGIDKPFCFNRKEAKDHGEGGLIVGESIYGRVLVIDDVITRGTAFRESEKLIQSLGGKIVGLVVSLDREEKNDAGQTAIEELEMRGLSVLKILSVRDLIQILESLGKSELAQPISAYLDRQPGK